MANIQRLLILLLVPIATNAWALNYWTISLAPQVLKSGYSDSPTRYQMTSEGAVLNLQYLERNALLLGYFPLQLEYKHGIPELRQSTYYASLRDFRTPDCLSGWITSRLDGYRITNNDPTHETGDVSVIQPTISYINYAKTYYLDFGYAASWYGESNIGNGGLRVSQFTPSFGMSFDNKTKWVRFRLYEIYASNNVRAQRVTHSDGLEITLSHYILYYPFYIPNRIDLDTFFGKRTYAVDSDALVVYNLGDVQRNSVYLQANWRLSSHFDFLINAGHYNFTTLISNVHFPYTMNYVFGSLTITM